MDNNYHYYYYYHYYHYHNYYYYYQGATGMTAHGILPVPTPATLRLLLGVPMFPGPMG